MGGRNSGTWYRYGKTPKVEDALELNAKCAGWGWGSAKSGTVRWSRNGETTSTISYRLDTLDAAWVELNYKKNDEPFKYRVAMDCTFPNYGGRRIWLRCPLSRNGRTCNRRVGKLYLPNGANYFGCRQCYRLSYESQSEIPRERLLRKAWKYQQRLDRGQGWGDLMYTPKPKGMHEKTYKKLHDAMERNAEIASAWAFRAFGFVL